MEKGTKGRHDSSDGCQSTSHFSTWASYLIASAVSWGSLKETRSAPGSVIRGWARLCDMTPWLLACQRETGQAQETERRETTVSLSKVLQELKWLQKWAVRQWFKTVGQKAFFCIYHNMHWFESSFLHLALGVLFDIFNSHKVLMCLGLQYHGFHTFLNSPLLPSLLFLSTVLSRRADSPEIIYSIAVV